MACIPGFSSTLRTTAFNGGPGIALLRQRLWEQTLSVLTHQLRCRCRWIPSRRRARQTAYTLDSRLSATAGPSQCDMPDGGGCSSRPTRGFKTQRRILEPVPSSSIFQGEIRLLQRNDLRAIEAVFSANHQVMREGWQKIINGRFGYLGPITPVPLRHDRDPKPCIY